MDGILAINEEAWQVYAKFLFHVWDLEKWETGWLTQLTQLTPQGSPKVGMVDEWYGGCGRWLFGGFGGG